MFAHSSLLCKALQVFSCFFQCSIEHCIRRARLFQCSLRRQIIVGIMPTAVTFLHCSERQSIEVAYILQEAQPTQRNRAMLRVIEYFAKSLKGSQGHSK